MNSSGLSEGVMIHKFIKSTMLTQFPVASFTEEVNPRLAKRTLVFNGRFANSRLNSLVKEAIGVYMWHKAYIN